MKNYFAVVFASLVFIPLTAQSVIWTENFETGAPGWNLNVVTGTEGSDPNFFLVHHYEGGGRPVNLGAPQSCGVASDGDSTLHITSVTFPTAGASYDAGGLCGILTCPQTNRRCESPVINCSNASALTVYFEYIENGQGLTDNASLWYFDGTNWTFLDTIPKSGTGCGGQGLWVSRNVALPVSANNNPNVKIAFRWENNDDGIGTDPSFAVDSIAVFEGSLNSGNTPALVFNLRSYPNPANESVTVSFTLPERGKTALRLNDVTGREIMTLFNNDLPSGRNELTIATAELPAGLYYYTLQTAAGLVSEKLLVSH